MKHEEDISQQIDPSLLIGESALRNTLLVATPGLHDSAFSRSVIFLCAHSPAGAMGIVINQELPDIAFTDLLPQLNIPQSRLIVDPLIHFGGPVESGRGFVLHSADFMQEDTLRINDSLCITGTIEILQAIAAGKGPDKSLFALGYAGWGAGQLDAEIQENAWLTVPVDDDLLFDTSLGLKWNKAMARLGVHNPLILSPVAGHS